jgi:hypothetical protein
VEAVPEGAQLAVPVHEDAVAVFDIVRRPRACDLRPGREERRTCNDKGKSIQGSFASLEDDEVWVDARSCATPVEMTEDWWLA